MKSNRRLALIVWLLTFIATESWSLTVFIYIFQGPNGERLEIWADDHFKGTKTDNLYQLQKFLGYIVHQKPSHLIVESPFFHGLDLDGLSQDSFTQFCNNKYGKPGSETWSFELSPQRKDATTWISWELPYFLLAFRNEHLPQGFYLPNNKDGVELLKNLCCRFFDPRPTALGPQQEQQLEKLMQNARDIFVQANENSPKKYREMMSSFVDLAACDSDNAKGAGVLDLHFISEIFSIINNKYLVQKNIFLLCGQYHALKVKEIMLQRDFKLMQTMKLAENPGCSLSEQDSNKQSVRRKLEF